MSSSLWTDRRLFDALVRRGTLLLTDQRVGLKFDAEDLAQETLTKALDVEGKYRGDESFAARLGFLFGIQTNLLRRQFAYYAAEIRDITREAVHRGFDAALGESLPDLQAFPADESSVGERLGRKEEVERLLERLSLREREIVELRDLKGFKFGEIAERLKLSEAVVHNTYYRAIESLADQGTS